MPRYKMYANINVFSLIFTLLKRLLLFQQMNRVLQKNYEFLKEFIKISLYAFNRPLRLIR